MMRPGDRVGLGLSGGADSTALLRIFCDLRRQLGITLFALHFHHQLRGADADEDERFVTNLAEEFGLEFEAGRANVAEEAKRRGWNLEDAGRRLRYRFFASAASARGLNRVAVAHTADDQAETVLSHLLRGTGLAGLAGIYPVSGLIIRPVLELRREKLRRYLGELGQPWREDITNRDTSRMRARIRHQLLPLLEREFSPFVVSRVARLADHAREDELFWRALEDERMQALAVRRSAHEISIPVANLLFPLAIGASSAQPVSGESGLAPRAQLALTRHLVRRIFAELRGSREQLTARHVESVVELAAKSQSGARIELPGVRVERIFDGLVFTVTPARTERSKAWGGKIPKREFTYKISNPGFDQSASIVVSEIHRRFGLKVIDWPPSGSETGDVRGAFDFDCVRWPLVLRNWRPGDAYRPHGSRRTRKLKSLLLESRVPQKERDGWPVLASGENVLWASGFPVADEIAAGQQTRKGLVISEESV